MTRDLTHSGHPRTRLDPDSVVGRLFGNGHRFEFFQAVWLLENLFADAPGPGVGIEPSEERIRLRPHSALVFPASDIREVDWADEDTARVTVTFMGLYGIDSPLPAYFQERIAAEADGAEELRDFLDIFNHRLFAYFFRSWKKYRPGLHFDRTYRNAHAETFLSLAGLGTAGAAEDLPVPALRLAAFAGRLGAHVHNADGLQALLAAVLERIPVDVVENVPRWVPLADPTRLGGKSESDGMLGVNMILGRRLFDVSGKFRVVLGPISFEQYLRLLPGTELARMVDVIVRMYAPDYLDYDVELRLDTQELPPTKLGGSGAQLGRNAWIGRPADDVVSEIVAYA